MSDTGVLQGKLVGGSNDDSLADIFLQFSPTEYWRDVVVPATNKMDPKLNLTYDELVGWIGTRLLMAGHLTRFKREGLVCQSEKTVRRDRCASAPQPPHVRKEVFPDQFCAFFFVAERLSVGDCEPLPGADAHGRCLEHQHGAKILPS